MEKPQKQFSRCKDHKEKENHRLCFGGFRTDLFWRISHRLLFWRNSDMFWFWRNSFLPVAWQQSKARWKAVKLSRGSWRWHDVHASAELQNRKLTPLPRRWRTSPTRRAPRCAQGLESPLRISPTVDVSLLCSASAGCSLLLSSSSRYLRFLPTIQRYAIATLLWLELVSIISKAYNQFLRILNQKQQAQSRNPLSSSTNRRLLSYLLQEKEERRKKKGERKQRETCARCSSSHLKGQDKEGDTRQREPCARCSSSYLQGSGHGALQGIGDYYCLVSCRRKKKGDRKQRETNARRSSS